MKVKEESENAVLKLNIPKQKPKTMALRPITSWQIYGETVTDFIFLCPKNHWGSDWSYEIKRHLLLERIAISNTDSILKSRHFTLLTKFCIIKTVIFLVVMELDHKEGWALKNWCFQTVMLEKIPESPLDSKEIQPVNPKGNQSWIFIGRTDAEAETLILWPPDARNWLIGREPDAVKDWRQEEKGTTENEMVGCYHWLNGHKFE